MMSLAYNSICNIESRVGWMPKKIYYSSHGCTFAWYFQHAHFIPIVGVGKRGAYELVHGDLPRQHSFGTTFEVYWACAGGLWAVNAIDT